MTAGPTTVPLPDDVGTLRLEEEDQLCWLVLDRPERLNAMSVRMRRELPRVLDLVADGPWRVLLLRGEGRAFSSGADLTDFLDEVDHTDADAVRAAVDGWHAVVRRLRELPQATVAAVHGPVYGGAANLALACDVVVAGDSLRMVQSYVDIGASVDLGGSWFLPRAIGVARARRLLLTGEPVDGPTAAAIGLVSEVVPDDELATTARRLGRVLAEKDPDVLRTIRRTVDQGLTATLDDQLDTEAAAVAALLGRPAFVDGTSRFARPTSGDPSSS